MGSVFIQIKDLEEWPSTKTQSEKTKEAARMGQNEQLLVCREYKFCDLTFLQELLLL